MDPQVLSSTTHPKAKSHPKSTNSISNTQISSTIQNLTKIHPKCHPQTTNSMQYTMCHVLSASSESLCGSAISIEAEAHLGLVSLFSPIPFGQVPDYMDYAYEDRGVYYFKWSFCFWPHTFFLISQIAKESCYLNSDISCLTLVHLVFMKFCLWALKSTHVS